MVREEHSGAKIPSVGGAGRNRAPAGIDVLRFCRGCDFRDDCVKFCDRYFSNAAPPSIPGSSPPQPAPGPPA